MGTEYDTATDFVMASAGVAAPPPRPEDGS